MFSIIERSRLAMHERTLSQAVEDAAQPNARSSYALAVGQVVAWLAASAGSPAGDQVRQVVDAVPPYSLIAADGMLLSAADKAFREGDLAGYHSRTILAGVLLSRVVEVSKPKLARRAILYRQQALDFMEPLLAEAFDVLATLRARNGGLVA